MMGNTGIPTQVAWSSRATSGAVSMGSGARSLSMRNQVLGPPDDIDERGCWGNTGGRPNLPADEDGLKWNHLGTSSAATPTTKDGEKGVARGLRVVGGSVARWWLEAQALAGEEGGL
jgi:hypothetical protein